MNTSIVASSSVSSSFSTSSAVGRRLHRFRTGLGVVLGMTALGAAACSTPFESGNGGDGGQGGSATASETSTNTGESSSKASTSSSSHASSNSSSTGGTPKCHPDQLLANEGIDASCGRFVRPGPTGGDGSQAHPFGNLADALASPDTTPIYVCATSATLDETVELVADEKLFGGFSCEDWSNAGMKTAWTAPTNAPVLRLSSTTGALVQGFAITARDATGFDAAILQGHASVAVVAEMANASILSCDITAGAAAAGGNASDNTLQGLGSQTNPSAFNGNPGHGCGSLAPAAKGGPAMCPATIGGAGGTGAFSGAAGAGFGGSPSVASEPNGTGGQGEYFANGLGQFCSSGQVGHDGEVGLGGTGGGVGGGWISDGYRGFHGGTGQPGFPGQGGGGGGGFQGNGVNGCVVGVSGPVGGGGAAGGCGGPGGAGGGPGGASIAVVAINSPSLVMKHLTLIVHMGGAGGDGAEGGPGGAGGAGGPSGIGMTCKGGDGGTGGRGGTGGGGAGGPSIGIGHVGINVSPVTDDVETQLPATGAPGGLGGTGGVIAASPGSLQNSADLTPE